MLYKPVVSLFMLFAATSGVAASATPVRRGGGYSLPAPIAPGQCTASQLCCNTVAPGSDPIFGLLDLLNPNLNVATNCGAVNVIAGCQSNTVCCQNVDQTGLINFNCVPINVNL